jgi:hypothetical protein
MITHSRSQRLCLVIALVTGGLLLTSAQLPAQQSVETDEFSETVQQLLLDLHPEMGITTPYPDLPPRDNVYRTQGPIWGAYDPPGASLLLMFMRRRLTPGQVPVVYNVGQDEVQTYQATMAGTVLVTMGPHVDAPFPVELTGPVETIALDKADQTTGTFSTEIVSMNLSGDVALPEGNMPILVRESPTLASSGQTDITDLGDGTYHIDSFFDVFTELSVDGGASWNPTLSIGLEDLAPPPELVAVVGASTWEVTFENDFGKAIDDNSNGLDEVETQIVAMTLTGNSSLGPVQVAVRGVDPPYSSTGQIEELVDNNPSILDVDPFAPGDAHSFFDVWEQISITGATLVTEAPLPVETTINDKPPASGERFVTPCVMELELVDSETSIGSGMFVLHKFYQPAPTIEYDQFDQTMAVVILQGGPLGQDPVPVVMSGPSEVHVYFEGPTDGDAIDDDMNGLDEVPAQLVSMTLSNGTAQLGIRSPSKSPFAASVGFIEEQVNGTPGLLELAPFAAGTADSFFDVYFEITVPSVGTLHNETAVRMEAEIEEKPPLDRYRFTAPSESDAPMLYLDNGTPTGIRVLSVIHATTAIETDTYAKTVQQLLLQVGYSGVETDDPTLPPTNAVITHTSDVYGTYAGPGLSLILSGARQRVLAPPQIETIGDDEMQTFDTGLCGTLTPTDGTYAGERLPMYLTGPVQTIASLKALSTTGTFDTEIVAMSLSGEATLPDGGSLPVLVRESPTLASSGQTTISDLGGGLYHIDSFFDVFTELSVDGGNSWISASEVVRVTTVPPPELVPLVGPAMVAVLFEGVTEGDAADDSGNSRDEVETEIVSLNLLGYSPQFGPVMEKTRPFTPTLGEIEEQTDNTPGTLDVDPFAPGNASSFFDLWAEITLSGTRRYTLVPLTIVTVINHKPPKNGERYITTATPEAELVDAVSGNPSGVIVVGKTFQPSPTTEHDVYTNAQGSIILNGGPFSVPTGFDLSGSAQVDVFFEGPVEGDAIDDDYNGVDEVVTELVSLDLTGGGMSLRLRDSQASPFTKNLGFLADAVNNTPGKLDVQPFKPGSVDSFFDVFFEIEFPDATVLHNEQPLRIRGTFSSKPFPTGDDFVGDGPIPLYDENNQPTGIMFEFDRFCPDVALDFGDAPDPPYPTTLANNGASHVIVPGLYLGLGVDGEPDGQPSADASGDDLDVDAGNPPPNWDDEDGITFPSNLVAGQSAPVNILAVSTSGTAVLNAWLDFDANGSWTDTGEQIITDMTVTNGLNTASITVPATPALGPTFARFRLSLQSGIGPDGPVASGEVEDYEVPLYQPAPAGAIAITNANTAGSSNAVIYWSAEAGVIYQLQENLDLLTAAWSNVGPPVVGPANIQIDPGSISNQVFYRIIAPWTQ